MNLIYERFVIAATDADLLAAGRLNSIPYAGQLTLRFQSSLADATNAYNLTIQLPGGDVPVDNQIVPGNNPALGGVMDMRTLLSFTFRVAIGGHVVVSLTESGTAICTIEAVLRP